MDFDEEDIYCEMALTQYEIHSQSTRFTTGKMPISNRFAPPVSDKDIESLAEARIPANSRRNMNWSLNAFHDWRKHRNSYLSSYMPPEEYVKEHIPTTNLELMTTDQYNFVLPRFIMEIKKQNGDRYPASSLFQLVSSLQAYIRMKGNNISFLKDEKFKKIEDSLDFEMKLLTKILTGANQQPSKQADIIHVDTEEQLWNEAILGSDNPEQLLYTVMYLLGYHFALRASDHKSLKINEQISVQIDEDGREFLHYKETTSKSYSGGLKSLKRAPRSSRPYVNLLNEQRCPVELYRKYVSLCPVENRPADFYLHPLALNERKPTLWYARRPVGIHCIEKFLKKMTDRLGIPGNFTPHSLRATNASRLYHSGVEEQLIQEQTGHLSLAVRKYKRTCSDQKVAVSNVLQNPPKKKKIDPFIVNDEANSEDDFMPSSSSLKAKQKPSATVSKPPIPKDFSPNIAVQGSSSQVLPTQKVIIPPQVQITPENPSRNLLIPDVPIQVEKHAENKDPDINVNVDGIHKTVSIQIRFQ